MAPDVDLAGTTIAGRYSIGDLLGRGGMGEVRAGRDLRLDRDVAIKILSSRTASDPKVRRRFEAEARTAAGLVHRNVVAVYDSGDHEGTPFLVMERLPGRTLADELAEGPIEPDRARRIVLDVLAALGAAHAAGIVHRDVKPANVLLGADGSAKVADFGIAKREDGTDLTATGSVFGTLAYVAPEQVSGGSATPRSDVYGVGVVLYEALSGRQAFPAGFPVAVAHAIEAGRATPLAELRPGLAPDLVAAVERAMATDPAARFATAAEMAHALGGDAEAAGAPAEPAVTPGPATGRLPTNRIGPVGARPGGGDGAVRALVRSRPAVVGVGVLLAVLAVVGLVRLAGPSAPGAGNVGSLPESTADMPAGTYATRTFRTPLQFTLDDGWQAQAAEQADVFALARRDTPGGYPYVSFLSVTAMLRPDRAYPTPSEILADDAISPVALDSAAWLTTHPRLQVLAESVETVDGVPGLRIDVRTRSAYPSAACPDSQCVLLFRLEAATNQYRVFKVTAGNRMRLYLVPRGTGLFVLAVEAPEPSFDRYAGEAEDVVKRVRFGS